MANDEKIANTNAKLVLEGSYKTRRVLDYSYAFAQSVDKELQPSGIPRGGKLSVTVDSYTKSTNNELLKILINRTLIKKLKIVVSKPSKPGEDLKVLEFEDVFCVDYKENWKDIRESKGDSASTEVVSFTWRKFTWDDVEYDNGWQ
jgi:type VI protein secretion system component Hcp